MKTKYGELIGRINLLDSDSEFDTTRNILKKNIIEKYPSIDSELESDSYGFLEDCGRFAQENNKKFHGHVHLSGVKG